MPWPVSVGGPAGGVILRAVTRNFSPDLSLDKVVMKFLSEQSPSSKKPNNMNKGLENALTVSTRSSKAV